MEIHAGVTRQNASGESAIASGIEATDSVTPVIRYWKHLVSPLGPFKICRIAHKPLITTLYLTSPARCATA